jgi:SAM-dependent methyltransferase
MKKAVLSVLHQLIKTGHLSKLMIWLIISVYKRRNRRSAQGKGRTTPWVCEFEYNVDRCVEYANRVFNDYFENAAIPVASIAGKRILEIGPGENLGVALRLLAAGAAEVVSVDRFNSLVDQTRQSEIYTSLLEQLTGTQRDRLKDVLTITDKTFSINPARLRYINNSIDELASVFPPMSFDLIISRAVLEHVFKIEQAMDVMELLLKKGGCMLHDIDFRDHGMFTSHDLHPLTMLSIPDKTWFAMTSNLGAPNRRLMGYYQSFFQKHAYACDITILRLFGEETDVKLKTLSAENRNRVVARWAGHRLTKKYWTATEPELFVAAASFCARKPG